ncbi:MAG: CapA family protein [Erysipelotrichaceae bacterium]|nr:CapA family protein [Erysipelotrichaceae bacterium]
MIKISFLGDIMLDYEMVRFYSESSVNLDKECYSQMLNHLRPLLSSSNYVIGNLETPISYDNSNLTYRKFEFNTSVQFAEAVKEAGVQMVTTANNHCMDRGVEGLKSTVRGLNDVGLSQCGIHIDEKNRYRIIDIDGFKIGVLAYTYGTNAFSNHQYLSIRRKTFNYVNLLQEQEGAVKRVFASLLRGFLLRPLGLLERLVFPENVNLKAHEKRTIDLYRKWLIRKDFRELKKENVDYTVACVHVGGQYRKSPSEYTKHTADWFIDRGTDLAVCNHEHVIHDHRFTDLNKLAVYSLGNCLGSSGVTCGPYGRRSEYSIALHVYINESDKRIEKFTFSVLKTILSERNIYETWPVFDLLRNEALTADIEQLKDESLQAASDFSGKQYFEVQEEFELAA